LPKFVVSLPSVCPSVERWHVQVPGCDVASNKIKYLCYINSKRNTVENLLVIVEQNLKESFSEVLFSGRLKVIKSRLKWKRVKEKFYGGCQKFWPNFSSNL
jgi:hypothetical protein